MIIPPKTLLNILVIVSIISIIFFLCSCTTEDDYIPNDPRKFSWTLDTLTSPRTDQSFRDDIWGSSSVDVYTVGFVDAGGSQMWHYDGKSWKFVPLQINQGGPLTFLFSF